MGRQRRSTTDGQERHRGAEHGWHGWHGWPGSSGHRGETAARDGRRDGIDVARVLALLVVVLGHLGLAVIDREGGSLRGANLLTLHPEWSWVAVAAPMPVFFAAAGWANARASVTSAAPRLRELVGAAAVVVALWSATVILTTLIAGEPGVVADGARIATQPVWFLAAYVPFAASGRRLSTLVGRSPILAIGSCVAVLGVLDVARFGLGAPEWIGWPGFFLAWGVPWLAGAWWRDRNTRGRTERWAGLVLAGAGATTAVMLVHLAGYSPSLIHVVDDARSNTTPPTLFTAVAGLTQVGVLMLSAGALDAAGRRWRPVWDRLGEAAIGVYLWHLSALALCAGVIALGLPVPPRLTPGWWWTRPLWFTAVVLVALGLVVATAATRARTATPGGRATSETVRKAVAGVALTVAGAGLVGLEGPRTPPLAIASTLLLIAAWLALRAATHPAVTSGRGAEGQPQSSSSARARRWGSTPARPFRAATTTRSPVRSAAAIDAVPFTPPSWP